MGTKKALKWWNSLEENPLLRIIKKGELCTKYYGQNRITSSLNESEIVKIYLSENGIQTDKKKSKTRKLDKDELRDISITITNKLIELGYVPDCTDTNDESEFEVQDMIVKVLKKNKLRIKTKK